MTLTGRLTLFVLAALGGVLLAFSGATYLLARTHLHRRLDERAAATLDTLTAAAEVEPDGLEWQPKDRLIRVHDDGRPPVWRVVDADGLRVDGSSEPFPQRETTGDALVVRRTLSHPDPSAVRSTAEQKRYAALTFETAKSTAPMRELLADLAWSLAAVSLALWLLLGLTARWFVRRALAPVIRMTATARTIAAEDVAERLPVPAPRDELHDLATAFNELLTRRQVAFERQTRFTAEASHQLRTPLTAMIGTMEVALRRDRDADEYRRTLTVAVGQAGRLSHLVEMLLYLARADVEARLPETAPFDLNDWLDGHLRNSWAEHPRAGDLRRKPADSGSFALVVAHPALLGQAVHNLIDNALKYGEAGTPVTVSITRVEGAIELSVEDQGRGIAAADAVRLFEPFFRAADVRQAGIAGIGLGLAVAARIVVAFGGSLRAERPTGRGSRFVVRLPSADAE